MSRLSKTFGYNPITISLVFILSILGISLFSAQKAEAYSVSKYYTIFTRGDGNFIHYSNSGFQLIDWTPQIFIADKYSGSASNDCSGGSFGKFSFNTSQKYTNCRKITIQEDKSTTKNNDWFENAWYAYTFGDFDHTEELSTSGGYISDWGSSLNTVNDSRQYAVSHSGDTDGKCDSPNYNTDDACTVLVLFDPGRAGDFGVTLDNKADSDTHEYRYKFPESNYYYHLFFNANGGTVADSPADSSTLYSHMSGAEVLREYEPGDTADTFPTPQNDGRIFLGWWTAPVGGSRVWSRTMNSDERLYAHWMPYNYYLTPKVTLNPTDAFEAGSPIAVTPEVKNDFPIDPAINTRSTKTNWSLSRIILPVSSGLPLPNPSSDELGDTLLATGPCTFFKNTYTYTKSPSTTCTTHSSDSDAIFLANRTTTLIGHNYYETDLNVGDIICYALSVQPRSNINNVSNTNWIHSVPDCAVVGKRPKIQVWGGDIMVGGSTDTSTAIKSGKTFGSWVEYAIFAVGNIKGTASGAAFAGEQGLSAVATSCDYSTLSFSNTPLNNPTASCTGVSNTIGNYTNLPAASNLSNSFQGGTAITSPTLSPDSLLSAAGTYIGTTGDITLTGSTLAPGESVILKSTGTVKIVGNQTYNKDNNGGKYKKISDLPQLVIIAKNIEIADDVDQIDAWLYTTAGGFINTCASNRGTTLFITDRLSADMCNKKLTVNGPVSTERLYLRRTAGSEQGTASGNPAEVFNLRADTYLWAYSRASSNNRITTVKTTEMPPRY